MNYELRITNYAQRKASSFKFGIANSTHTTNRSFSIAVSAGRSLDA